MASPRGKPPARQPLRQPLPARVGRHVLNAQSGTAGGNWQPSGIRVADHDVEPTALGRRPVLSDSTPAVAAGREAGGRCPPPAATVRRPAADGPGWEGLGDLVAKAAALASTAVSDPLNHVLGGYSRFRRYTPRMLRTLDIEASPAAGPLLEAVGVLRSDGTARPTGFLRPNSRWSRLLRTQSDHRLWETAVLFPPAGRVPRQRRLAGAVAPLRRHPKGAAVDARRR